jgi:hypothetical protein
MRSERKRLTLRHELEKTRRLAARQTQLASIAEPARLPPIHADHQTKTTVAAMTDAATLAVQRSNAAWRRETHAARQRSQARAKHSTRADYQTKQRDTARLTEKPPCPPYNEPQRRIEAQG